MKFNRARLNLEHSKTHTQYNIQYNGLSIQDLCLSVTCTKCNNCTLKYMLAVQYEKYTSEDKGGKRRRKTVCISMCAIYTPF